jgi:hypothetical protein
MSFWQGQAGKSLTGSAEDSFNSGFSPIPDGTVAVAMIKSFEFVESAEYDPKYQVRWKIADGEFKNREVFQNIYAFDKDPERNEKAKNMMMRIYKLCGHKPSHNNAPTNQDLAPMQGSLCTIKIGMYVGKDGKKRNSLDEVHESNYAPEQPAEGLYDSALSRNRTGGAPVDDSDIPF